jgi:hypothetical protein
MELITNKRFGSFLIVASSVLASAVFIIKFNMIGC